MSSIGSGNDERQRPNGDCGGGDVQPQQLGGPFSVRRPHSGEWRNDSLERGQPHHGWSDHHKSPRRVVRQSDRNDGEFGGGNRFDNAGTFRKSLNAGIAAWPVTFNNSGLVEIQTGRLTLSSSGTHSGRFEIAAAASLNFAGGSAADAASIITGAGDLIVNGTATTTLAGLVNPTGMHTFSGGTANLNGNYICTNNPVTISGGTVNFNGTSTVAKVNLSSGTLGGTGLLSVMNEMNWSGGTMAGSGRTVIPPGASLNLANPATVALNTRTLEMAAPSSGRAPAILM